MAWFQPVYGLDFPLLADRVGIDEIGSLGTTISGLEQHPWAWSGGQPRFRDRHRAQ